jgi:acetoin utilization deacetylase AcuC-like enzyme
MLVIYNPLHRLHQGRVEMFRGRLVPCHETPQRLDHVLAELRHRSFELRLSDSDGDGGTGANGVHAGLDAALAQIHAPRYLHFLEHAWAEWVALDPANAAHDALPSVWPAPGMRFDVLPESFAARMGLFAFDAGTPLTAGSWVAARAGAACAIAAARAVLRGEARSAFALTRPPGHHAGAGFFGGYCFLNNAALAAQAFRDGGARRVAVLDVDYHHGNGTQAIFDARGDVLTVSIHGDPRTEYPFFLGHADERGSGAGAGCNLNLPLPRSTGFVRWREALHAGLAAIRAFGADALVVALGVDTFEGDPIAGFLLRSADYLSVGQDIAGLTLPTVFVFEGGYAVDAVGVNTVNVLEGFGV